MSHPPPSTESKTLLAYLDAQRKHVLGILEGLDEEALRRPVLPSGWSCMGLVRHLALDDERFWFRGIVAGELTVIAQVAEAPDDAWQVGPDVPVEAVFDMYRQQIDLANAIITATPLDVRARLVARGAVRRLAARQPPGGHPARSDRDRSPRRAPRRGA